MTSRRGFLSGVAALLAAPAIIRTPGLLMPVKRVRAPAHTWFRITMITITDGGLIVPTFSPILAPGVGYHPSDRITIT